ncbi:MAG: molybdopterin-guanine dinucleotide biosynthesis protein B [Candidatus Syntrophosphaera sp.]
MIALGITGYHHTGKTTLATRIISLLRGEGRRVASIKDIHNEDYRADQEGSNSWKHAQAGADQVFARGLHDAALILTPSPDIPRMLDLIYADWLVIEGLKEAAVPKILCARDAAQADELLDGTVFALWGGISEDHETFKGLPVLPADIADGQLLALVRQNSFEILPHSDTECCGACGRDCYQMAADIVQGRAKRSDCVLDSQNSITLSMGGEPVTIVPFVQNILRDGILGMVDNLKGIDPSKDIEIRIKR